MAKDPAIVAHQEWIGYVQPTGLVVSIPALIEASAFLNRNYGPDHQRFLSALPQDSDGEAIPETPDFLGFARDVLGWDTDLMLGAPGADPVPTELEAVLENYNETLRPTYALRNLTGDNKWLLLVEVLPTGTDLDQVYAPHDRGWQASPQARFERLLRQTGVSTGLLVNGRQIRLVYAPEKELSGHITFKLSEMVRVAGRPIFAALLMLLSSERLYSVADKERLPAILANSRKYQNVVSTQLASQVLEALYELLRGFQAANDQTKGALLRDVLAQDPDHVYRGLLTTLLRLVFVLYAEDRGLLSTDPIYSNHYSVTGLYERLRADAGRYNDTMDRRYGAWAQLLALFRLIYSGGSHAAMKIPAREGYLFDHDRYLFLEGRHGKDDKPVIPQVPDGVVYRVLSKLLLLDGERLSYRTLAVEQIGSVYEAIMGFELKVASGSSIAIRPVKQHGAPATVNLEELLRTPADKRMKLFTETTDQKLTGQAAEGLKSASTIEELLVALDRKIAKAVTPNVVRQGAMIFQPSNERRRSGSHYTPSTLTGPIVEAALAPVLKQLGENPKPEQILGLKVCDPAMGSGAFLVEVCRQLGDRLVMAWHTNCDFPPVIPIDEDEALHAQRLVAQQCVYGVDKNPMAADLAKLSLWLATLAKDHPFTFLDHSLRSGDSLVGLSRRQIAAFHWDSRARQHSFIEEVIGPKAERIGRYRQRILDARDNIPYSQLHQALEAADYELNELRRVGDTIVAAFFSASKPKAREMRRQVLSDLTERDLRHVTDLDADREIEQGVNALHAGDFGVRPFHWELEFPEVFRLNAQGQPEGGFDAIVGNPPFVGGTRISTVSGMIYFEWLVNRYSGCAHLCDLAAYFFRRCFELLKPGGTFGLIATNTISQGDTREGGLLRIIQEGGVVYRAVRRFRWPGEVSVVVSIVHVAKQVSGPPCILDGKPASRISAFLSDGTNDASPRRLSSNPYFSLGSKIYGQGFLFANDDSECTSISLYEALVAEKPSLKSRIRPYIGGEEILSDPFHRYHRYVIQLSDIQTEAELDDWPELRDIVRAKVKPERDVLGENPNNVPLKRKWWAFQAHRPELYTRLQTMDRVLVTSQVNPRFGFALMPSEYVFSHKALAICISSHAGFAVVQSSIHEMWARFFSSTSLELMSYTPSDCFETFPFPRVMSPMRLWSPSVANTTTSALR